MNQSILTSIKIQIRFSEIWHSFSALHFYIDSYKGYTHCLCRPPTQRVHVTSIIRWQASSQQRVRPVSLSVSDVVIRTHVCRTVVSCIAALHQLRSIRHLVSATVFQSLVAALFLCRLNYGNGILVGLPAYIDHRLSVQNAAAQLVFHLHRSDHFTDALTSLQKYPNCNAELSTIMVYASFWAKYVITENSRNLL